MELSAAESLKRMKQFAKHRKRGFIAAIRGGRRREARWPHVRKDELKSLCKRWELSLVVLFGSVVKGRLTPRSDVDIAVSTRRQVIDLNYRHGVITELSSLLQAPNLDVVFLNDADPFLQFEVSQQGICLFESKQGDFQKFQLFALKMHEDSGKLQAWFREYTARTLEALRG